MGEEKWEAGVTLDRVLKTTADSATRAIRGTNVI